MVAGLLCLRSAVSVELWIDPAGPVLEGSTVTINCRSTDKDPLDIVRLVRVVDDVAHELTTNEILFCLLYTSPSPRDGLLSRMPSSA